jgi:hypothetical protein
VDLPPADAGDAPPPVSASTPVVEIVPGDESDVDRPTAQDDPAYLAAWNDPAFRAKVYGYRVTPEEQERRQRINVSFLSFLHLLMRIEKHKNYLKD